MRGDAAEPWSVAAASFLDAFDRRFRRQAGAPACEAFLAGLLPFAGHRALGKTVPNGVPVAKRIAVPWLPRRDRRQIEFPPDLQRAFHEFALWQRDWRVGGFLSCIAMHCQILR